MDELDDLFNKFEEKSSSLNERLEQLLAMDETTNAALSQLAGDMGNLQLTGASADFDALNTQIDRLQGNKESSNSDSPNSSSAGDSKSQVLALGSQIDSLTSQIESFANKMDKMEKVLIEAGVVEGGEISAEIEADGNVDEANE